LWLADLASWPESGGNTELGQNIGLEKHPQDNNQNQPTDTHLHKSSQNPLKSRKDSKCLWFSLGGSKQHTAVAPQAQENPPDGAAQEEDPMPFPPADDPQEKDERSLQTSFLPQEGQAISSSLSEAKTSCSNV
jgi:hypothetical protein